jgi:hypothetical protein
MGLFARMMKGLASDGGRETCVMIDVEPGRRHRLERPAEAA